MMGHLEKLLAPTMDAMGYEVVRVMLSGSQHPTLQVMAERRDGAPMTVADCETLSRALSAVLDVEDPIPGAYRLEVSSPGLDRPLTRPADYARFVGQEARIETDRLIDGQRRFKGVLLGIDAERIISLRLAEATTPDQAVARIPFGAVTRAKLLVTDALIAQALAGAQPVMPAPEAAEETAAEKTAPEEAAPADDTPTLPSRD